MLQRPQSADLLCREFSDDTNSEIHTGADYLIIDDESGAVNAWENGGPDASSIGAWRWTPRGQIATGIGTGKGQGAGVRFADFGMCDTPIDTSRRFY